MKEPLATVTNAAYAVAGAAVFVSEGWLAAPYAASLFLLAVGSWGYHATLDGRWQTRDEQAMYVALSCLVALAGAKLAPALFALFLPAGVALGVLLSREWARLDSHIVVPGLSVVALGLVALRDPVGATIAAALIGASAYVRSLGERGRSPKRGADDLYHSAWHFGSAYALYLGGLL